MTRAKADGETCGAYGACTSSVRDRDRRPHGPRLGLPGLSAKHESPVPTGDRPSSVDELASTPSVGPLGVARPFHLSLQSWACVAILCYARQGSRFLIATTQRPISRNKRLSRGRNDSRSRRDTGWVPPIGGVVRDWAVLLGRRLRCRPALAESPRLVRRAERFPIANGAQPATTVDLSIR